ncbi:hypothetical protein AV530_007701 [Patagioenas fasciata monilis]|uniref:Uncharacterized protein n=1 Tax=Patagioenas fasciata monilis TaxID=372326 RepID=A0A1V4JZ41_PATFA|nr:hypothetical protein AV530_007701 [Patagioenas fasciata monilis]
MQGKMQGETQNEKKGSPMKQDKCSDWDFRCVQSQPPCRRWDNTVETSASPPGLRQDNLFSLQNPSIKILA